MTFSFNDAYPQSNLTLSTTEQSIPEADENKYYSENVATDNQGNKVVVNKGLILGSLGLIIIIMIFMDVVDVL